MIIHFGSAVSTSTRSTSFLFRYMYLHRRYLRPYSKTNWLAMVAAARNRNEPEPEPRPTASSSEGTAYLIIVQIVSRALTFLANQLLLRHLSPSIFGAATQLELYAISVVYFSRESVRVTVQRQPEKRGV